MENEKMNEEIIRRAVVTGATGAVGMALVKELVGRGIEVLALCRTGSGRAKRLNGIEGVEIEECSLENLDTAGKGCRKPYDAFFHLAWQGTTGEARNDAYLQTENVRYALDAVSAAKRFGCKVFVGAGSQAEYGRAQPPLAADTPAFPENGYGIAKLCAGQLTRLLANRLGMRQVWARILSVYGPYDGENSMVMSAITALLAGRTPKFTAGEQLWDYLYSEDAARALRLMAEKGRDGGVYPLGCGQARPLKEYILAFREAVDENAEVAIGAVPYPSGQVMNLAADISALKKETGWTPRVPFEEGIQTTVTWVKNLRNA